MVGNAIGRFVIRGRNEKLMKFPISTKRISADTSLRVVSKQILFGLIFKAFPCVYLFKIIWEVVPKGWCKARKRTFVTNGGKRLQFDIIRVIAH